MRRYWVVFTPRNKSSFWNFFLHKEIFHCYLITQITDKHCVMIDPQFGGTVLKCFDVSAADFVLDLIDKGNRNIIECYTRDMVKPKIRWCKTCTTVVRDFLGIDEPFIITAKHLFRFLKRS